MKKLKIFNNNVVIYQGKNGGIELRGDIKKETVWATQAQIAEVFGVERSVVTKHVRNIFKRGEVEEKSNVQKMHIPNSDKPVAFYNLDIILAIGYRTNSTRAIEFRKWATEVLRQHLVEGYTINRSRISENYDTFIKSVEQVQALLPEHIALEPKIVLELIKEFAGTWMSLDAYDKDELKPVGATKRAIKLSVEELQGSIGQLRDELMKKGEATELFAHECKAGSVEGIVGNVMQSFGGVPMYKTAEEKAAHLLYFMVKNHPFSNGNKRSGAFAFIWFLRKAKIRKSRNINPAALTALTLLVAESSPKDKEQITALITHMLR